MNLLNSKIILALVALLVVITVVVYVNKGGSHEKNMSESLSKQGTEAEETAEKKQDSLEEEMRKKLNGWGQENNAGQSETKEPKPGSVEEEMRKKLKTGDGETF